MGRLVTLVIVDTSQEEYFYLQRGRFKAPVEGRTFHENMVDQGEGPSTWVKKNVSSEVYLFPFKKRSLINSFLNKWIGLEYCVIPKRKCSK